MSYKTPETLKYTKDHEWANLNGETVTIGITDFAQSSLGDVVFVELPEVGTKLAEGAAFGVVESIKSVSDLYSPLAGEVVEVNSDLEDTPDTCNSDPYGGAWMIKLKLDNSDDFNNLMNSTNYQGLCE